MSAFYGKGPTKAKTFINDNYSQIVFDPEYAFEIFVLDRPPGAA